MRIEKVEIYSDATNAAVMRCPGRKFPGLLLQGDTLNALKRDLEQIVSQEDCSAKIAEEIGEIVDRIRELDTHYKRVFADHGLSLPFV